MAQPWSQVYNNTDVKLISFKIMDLFLNVLDKHAPKKIRTKKGGKCGRLNLSKEKEWKG